MHLQENLRYRLSRQPSHITGRSNTQPRNKSDLMLQQGEQSCVNSPLNLTYLTSVIRVELHPYLTGEL